MMDKDDLVDSIIARLDETRIAAGSPTLTGQQRADIAPFIEAIASSVVAHITNFATVTIPIGIPVTVTPATGIGATTAAATGTIA